MKPRISVITLGVADLERAVRFYRDGLGLPTKGMVGKEFEHGAVAFFELEGGLALAVWPRTSLAHDAQVPLGTPNATELSLGHNVRTKAEVDAVMAVAVGAGATFRIRMAISGKLSGIRSACRPTETTAPPFPSGSRTAPGVGASGRVA